MRKLVEQIADLFLEAAQDASLGLADGDRRHAQFGGERGGRTAVQNGTAERLPGTFLEVAAQQGQGPLVDLANLALLLVVGIGGESAIS
jgi:hypothetical protein